ncbi:MAG: M48 family metallopeptidase [Gammaproteobacteria bacterium]|nr:M48 family metallopeptidase [Gammaproteobacteria bacterium]
MGCFVNVRSSALVVMLAVVCGCATSPLGRNQLILYPESEMQQMGITAYQEMQREIPRETASAVTGYVQCVVDHIVRAMPGGNAASWEITVFADDQPNAFALPGGKIGVYTGMLDVAQNQHQLAAVVAHEVAHVTARHSNERVSTNFVTQTGLQLAQVAAGGNSPARQQLFGLLGVGAQFGVLLPFGRAQESEADLVGLDYMARAGFDPRESVRLWENMAKVGGAKPPEFLSTHPSGDRRMRDLNARMRDAMSLSVQARSSGRNPDCR